MKCIVLLICSLVILYSCKTKEALPDVSGYNPSVVIQRFDKDFFAADTLELDEELNRLNAQYPHFLPDYLVKVLGINPSDPKAISAISSFIRTYLPVYKVAQKVAESELPAVKEQIETSIKYMHFYVPQWKPDSPFVITTFIGPMDAFEPFPLGDYGDVRTSNGAGIALQFHLGANDPLYEDGRLAGLFYDYQVRRFTPQMMAVNSIKNIITDAFPYNEAGNSLVEEMIEKGKRMFLLDKLMPSTEDSLKLGYTGIQVKGCYSNEALIWNYFVKNDLLYSKENSVKQAYVKDGPKTAELGEAAPGYIGLFIGRQIVRSFMEKHPEVSMTELMKLPAKSVLDEAGYKP